MSKYAQHAPRLSEWMETNLPEGFTVFIFPVDYRRTIWTAKALERINREIRRSTWAASNLPNAKSCLRLMVAKLMETSEEWLVGKRYYADLNN